MQPTSILLADAQYLIRHGLKQLLVAHKEFNVVGEAKNEEELLAKVKLHQPRVVIVDYNQPNHFSPVTVEKIKRVSPLSNIMIVSGDKDKQKIYHVIESGINSFLSKSCDKGEIIDAVQATAKGEKFFCGQVLDLILERSFSKPSSRDNVKPLSAREIQIVRLIAKGFLAKEIADQLSLSTHTIYTHRKNIMKKLNLTTSSELIMYAVNHGLVDLK